MTRFIGVFLLMIILNNQIMSQETKLSTSELIVNSTIRIECTGDTIVNGKKGRFSSTGTGFYFKFSFDSLLFPVIVTNYHVIKNTDICILNFTESVDNVPKYGSIITDTLTNADQMWIKHPSVDLAILPINPIIKKIKTTKSKIPFITNYTEDLLPTKTLLEDITAIEEVLMIGYPKGLWDKTNNLPIVRKGITATPLYIDYEGKKQFLIDIPNFGGSSGSPIVLFNQGSYSTRKGGLTIGNRIALLGINVEYYHYSAKGELILPPNNPKIETEIPIPINIALIIKAEELLDFKPILKKLLDSSSK